MKKRGRMNNLTGGPRNLFMMLALFALALLALTKLTEFAKSVDRLSYDQFVQHVKAGEVKEVTIDGQEVVGYFKDGRRFESVILQSPQNSTLLLESGTHVNVQPPANPMSFWYLIFMALLGFGMLGLWFFFRQTRGQSGSSGNIFNIGKSKAKMFMPMQVKTTFSSVAGVQEAKEELKDVVDFLKNPEKFRRLGAKLTRGCLLIGEPGNGKTMLAKAVAGEANCPFFTITGSDFIEVFVGVGAARVRDLFAQARKHSPSIIFIDEIDAIGRQRSTGMSGGGHEEREQTLNQLLAEMDGFETNGAAVVVMAATNRPDILDKALLRPGRFDRKVEVPYPDLDSREQILKIHAKSIKLDESVDLRRLARGTPGFTGADLANLVNEAAIHASKQQDKKTVTIENFEEARDKAILGKERKSIIMSEKERLVTAYHEAGHALMILLNPEHSDPLHKITIVPRSGALGVTCWLPERDKYLETKEEQLASIITCFGGRVAEELKFNQITGGAANDFHKATNIARSMVYNQGMADEMGPLVYYGQEYHSEQTVQQLDNAIRKIVDNCYVRTKELMAANLDKLESLAQALLEKETMHASDVYELLAIEPREDHRLT